MEGGEGVRWTRAHRIPSSTADAHSRSSCGGSSDSLNTIVVPGGVVGTGPGVLGVCCHEFAWVCGVPCAEDPLVDVDCPVVPELETCEGRSFDCCGARSSEPSSPVFSRGFTVDRITTNLFNVSNQKGAPSIIAKAVSAIPKSCFVQNATYALASDPCGGAGGRRSQPIGRFRDCKSLYDC